MPQDAGSLSICLIVRNEESNLSLTLPALLAGTDEVIVVDTGSTDNTIKIAQDLGAQVFSLPWPDDFSKARNFSLSKAKSEWILWVDADEFIRASDLRKIKEILNKTDRIAFELYIKECALGEFEANLYYRRIKIFRNFLGIHFGRPINEQLFDSAGQLLKAEPLEFSVFHWGSRLAISQEKFLEKKRRNIAALKSALTKNQNDPLYHFLLGVNYQEINDLSLAIAHFQEAKELTGDVLLKYEALVKTAWCFFGLNLFEEVIITADEAIKIAPDRPEARVIKAAALNMQKKYEKTLEVLADGNFGPAVTGLVIDLTYYAYLPNYVLGEAHLMLGHLKESLKYFEAARELDQKDESLRKKIEILKAGVALGIEYFPAGISVRAGFQELKR